MYTMDIKLKIKKDEEMRRLDKFVMFNGDKGECNRIVFLERM
jgi:hypothetical protein